MDPSFHINSMSSLSNDPNVCKADIINRLTEKCIMDQLYSNYGTACKIGVTDEPLFESETATQEQKTRAMVMASFHTFLTNAPIDDLEWLNAAYNMWHRGMPCHAVYPQLCLPFKKLNGNPNPDCYPSPPGWNCNQCYINTETNPCQCVKSKTKCTKLAT